MPPLVCLAKWKGSEHQLQCKLAEAPLVMVHSADVVGAETAFECGDGDRASIKLAASRFSALT